MESNIKSACQLFEELGYNVIYQNKHYMFYVKDLVNTPEYERDCIHLEFNFDTKTFNKTYGDDNTVYEITVEELKAINQQIKELGWLDE